MGGYAADLRAFILLWGRPALEIAERKMFGGLAFMANGYMFVGVIGETLMARVGADAYKNALKRSNVREMDFTGKPMMGYVYVDAPALKIDRELLYWLDACLGFVSSLPPKTAKPGARLKP